MGVLNTISNTPTPDLKKNKFNKSRVNCTTQDFFAMKPVYSAEVMAQEDVSIDMGAFTRLAPMVRPTYARCKMVNRAFYVPYRTVWRPWSAFLTQEQFEDGVVPSAVPQFKVCNLQGVFIYPFDLTQTSYPDSNNEDYRDLIYINQFNNPSGGTYTPDDFKDYLKAVRDVTVYMPCPARDDEDWTEFNRFFTTNGVNLETETPEGIFRDNKNNIYYFPYLKFNLSTLSKRIYDILVNLGYNISLDIFKNISYYNYTHTSNLDELYPAQFLSDQDSRFVSALPLLSYLKVWSDWYRYQQWQPSFDGVFVESFFTIGTLDVQSFFTIGKLVTLFKFLTVNQYDKDYFTCAELEPISRYDTQSITIPDNTVGSDDVQVTNTTNSVKTPTMFNNDNLPNFSQFAVDALRKLTNFMMRYKIAGGRVLDRMLLQYGVKLDSEKLQRSVYLGKYEQPIQIMDVTATSSAEIDGETQYLGDYAGKGVSQGSGHFELKHNKEFGQLIILSLVAPEISYYQGLKREMVHLTKFDFFDGNFDGLGYQAVRKDEVMNVFQPAEQFRTYDLYGALVSIKNPAWLLEQVTSDGVFGFLPRYAEYKQSDNADILSGDYRVHSSGAESLRYFNLFRELNMHDFPVVNQSLQIQQSPEFSWVGDSSQYDKIFSDTTPYYDHFLTFFSFEVRSYQPCKQLFDSYDFGDDNEHNKHVKMSFGGTRF